MPSHSEAASQHLTINDLPRGILHHAFSFLGPKDLCCAGSTCTLWRTLTQDAASDCTWQQFYAQRWRAPAGRQAVGRAPWQRLYARKVHTLRLWPGKFQADFLYGHKAGVRSVAVLPAANLALTGSVDCTLRIWDLAAGTPLSVWRHPATVRCLAADERLLVSGTSGVDSAVRVFPVAAAATASTAYYDLSAGIKLESGHQGPVTAVALSDRCIYSGSWDYTVRAWGRGSLAPAATLQYDDWVWSVAPRGRHLLVATGASAYAHDAATGQLLAQLRNLRAPGCPHTLVVEGTRDSRLLFTGAGDGLLRVHDLRAPVSGAPAAVLGCGGGPRARSAILSLKMEDPWLAAALADGSTVLLDAQAAMRAAGREAEAATCSGTVTAPAGRRCFAPVGSPAAPAYCVDLADGWLAAGSESPVCRVWNFTHAAAAEQRSQAGRAARRRSARERRAQQAAHRIAAPPVPGSAAQQAQRAGSPLDLADRENHAQHHSSANCAGAAQPSSNGQALAPTCPPARPPAREHQPLGSLRARRQSAPGNPQAGSSGREHGLQQSP